MKQDSVSTKPEETFLETNQKYFTFLLNEQVYAISGIDISEIINYQVPTLLPGAPSHVKGLINLRGTLIPVVSLKEKMGLTSREKKSKPVIVVLFNQATKKYLGLIVDSALDVSELNIKDMSESTKGVKNGCETLVSHFAMANDENNNEITLVLDVNKLYELFIE